MCAYAVSTTTAHYCGLITGSKCTQQHLADHANRLSAGPRDEFRLTGAVCWTWMGAIGCQYSHPPIAYFGAHKHAHQLIRRPFRTLHRSAWPVLVRRLSVFFLAVFFGPQILKRNSSAQQDDSILVWRLCLCFLVCVVCAPKYSWAAAEVFLYGGKRQLIVGIAVRVLWFFSDRWSGS